MQFVLNSELVNEREQDADTTLLQYLREQRRLCGTKEGCASGDCGACTVLLGKLVGERINYRALNACITPISVVQGGHLVTVEHLSATGQLHPCQAAMVAHHGSQCGFCTPGFVMSLAGLYESKAARGEVSASRDEICTAISGNLCRCTGYRPIIEAGMAMMASAGANIYRQDTLQQLRSISSPRGFAKYFQPRDITELQDLLRHHINARIIAGGTDLMLDVTQRYRTLDCLIDVSHVAQLNHCDIAGAKISLGAALTYAALEEAFADTFPQLSHLLHRLGSPQIRNRGTLGGNLGNASPVADMPPLLLCLDAELEIGDCRGNRRLVDINDFYLGYKKTVLKAGEFLIAIHLQRAHLNDFHRFYKISKRWEDDIASIMAAIRFTRENGKIRQARIAFGGVAATPVRVAAAEQAFVEQDSDSQTALLAAQTALRSELSPLSDVRASADYRMEMAVNVLTKSWLELNGRAMADLGGTRAPRHA